MKKILLLATFAFIGFTSLEAQSDRNDSRTRSDNDRTTRTSDRNDRTKGSADFQDTIEEMTSSRKALNCDHLNKVLDYITDNMGSDDVDSNSLAKALKSLPVDDCKPTRGCDCKAVRENYTEIVKQMRQ